MDAKLLDAAAMSFTRAFYLSLLSGTSVRRAFDIAREALKSSPYVVDSALEGEKFVLLPEHASHDVPLFKCPQVPRWPGLAHMAKDPSSANIDVSLVPGPPPDFEGREVTKHRATSCCIYLYMYVCVCVWQVDMFRVISTLKERRLVSVVGDAGLGKSALVAAVARYVLDRGMFAEGVLFVRLAGVATHAQFLQAFRNALSRGPPRVARSLGGGGAASPKGGSIDELEESMVKCLAALGGRALLVLDHADELLAVNDTAADLKYFLQKVFERCEGVRLLVTYCSTADAAGVSSRVDSVGVVEHCVTLGSLTLLSTLRLFARLAPCLPSAQTKQSFVDSLLPRKQANSTFTSKELTPAASQIFCLFGRGHPATIVKMACEADVDSVTLLQGKGRDVLLGKKPRKSISSSRSTSRDNDEPSLEEWVRV